MKKRILTLTIFFVAGVFTSCNDFLERTPQSLAVDEKFWTTESEAQAGVLGGYSLLREALSNVMAYWAYGDVPTGEFTDVAGYDFEPVRQFNLSLSVPAAEFWRPMRRYRDWSSFYKVIDQSNRIIERVSAIPEGSFTRLDKNHLVGEGYFLRAFTYFYMTRIWGGVPLITKAYNDPLTASFYVERATEEEVHQQIESDIEKAIELLTAEQLGRPGSRANRAVAYALKAHLRAWQGDYTNALEALNSFEAEGGYGYGPRTGPAYLDRFYHGNTEDNVFYIPRLIEDNESSNRWGGAIDSDIGNNTGVWIGNERYHIQQDKEAPNWQMNKTRLAELYTSTDSVDFRYKYGFKYTEAPYNFPVVMKYLNFSVGSAVDVSRYSYVINIFRYTELRLLKAEALAALGQGEGLTILNEVRKKNNLPVWDGTGTLYEAVMEERARELFLEGHRFYDMVRMAKYKGVFKFTNMTQGEFTDGKYYWPVDPLLFTNNPSLKQTAYWSSLL